MSKSALTLRMSQEFCKHNWDPTPDVCIKKESNRAYVMKVCMKCGKVVFVKNGTWRFM